MSESSYRNCVAGRTIDWRHLIEEIAGPLPPHGAQERWFFQAARACGLSARKIESLWRGECKDPKFSIAIRVLSAAEKARAEASALATRFENAAGALNEKDPEFHRADVLALISAANKLRGMDRA